MQLRVRAITYEAEGINAYELVDPAGAPLPAFTAGAHLDIRLPGKFLRQYSLCNDPAERHRYVVAVLKEVAGRGGSKAFHTDVRAGDLLEVSEPRNNFRLVEGATRYLFVAGGVGITPIMAMVTHLRGKGAAFVLHYCTRTPERAAFRDRLGPLEREGQVKFHFDGGDPSRGLDVAALLARHEPGTHLYCCGPTVLMEAVKAAAAHWPKDCVHFEYFAPVVPVADLPEGEDFQVKIASTGAVYTVPKGRTILEVLREHGMELDSSCEAGTCGTCITPYLEGVPDHRDYVLTEQEQAKYLMICCSRSKTATLTLDL
jgi:vanillate O-demethylase ferredoxin subunit